MSAQLWCFVCPRQPAVFTVKRTRPVRTLAHVCVEHLGMMLEVFTEDGAVTVARVA